jgi:hypothetical protein
MPIFGVTTRGDVYVTGESTNSVVTWTDATIDPTTSTATGWYQTTEATTTQSYYYSRNAPRVWLPIGGIHRTMIPIPPPLIIDPQLDNQPVWPARQAPRAHAQPRTQSDIEAAKNAAMELLLAHLSEQQRETFHANGWFIVEGGKSKKRYRIRAHDHLVANVDRLNGNGNVLFKLCAHCRRDLIPLGDQLLAQKLMLEADEERFLAIANRH